MNLGSMGCGNEGRLRDWYDNAVCEICEEIDKKINTEWSDKVEWRK